MRKKLAEQYKETSTADPETQKISKAFFPTGVTLLNLACADNPFAGYSTGTMVNLLGDSSSGKTFLVLTMLADMANDKKFKDYTLLYDDAEAGNSFEIERLFGKKTKKRIQTRSSNTIADFQTNVFQECVSDQPFVYVLDSFDGLTTEEELEKFMLKAEGKKVQGSYGMHKAKGGHELFRVITGELVRTKSLLVVISQLKDDISISYATKKRTGGHSLTFFASHIVWTGMIGKEKSKERIIGINAKARVDKNRSTGKIREIIYPVYYSYGVDSTTSSIDFLLKEKHWNTKKLTIIAPEFEFEGTKKKLIDKIESENLERNLAELVGKVWNKIEASLVLKRKPKYE